MQYNFNFYNMSKLKKSKSKPTKVKLTESKEEVPAKVVVETVKVIRITLQEYLMGRLRITVGNVIYVFYYVNIIYIESDGNYITVHEKSNNTTRLKSPIGKSKKLLPHPYFLTVHNSFIVNRGCVTKYKPLKEGGMLYMVEGKKVRVSLKHQEEVVYYLDFDGDYIPQAS